MTGFVTALHEGVLMCDGAMGTMLHAAGNSLDRALPELNLSNAELVSTVHESYLSAGVDVIQTNTFGASALRLAEHGSAGPVREINLAGVRIARAAQDKAGRRVFVAGSVSPAVTARQRPLLSPAQRVAAIREQVSALAEGGVDVLILETFGYLDELAEAVTAAAELTGAPIVAQATFAPDGRTLGGETPREVAIALSRLPVVALGTNCTLGPQHTLTVVTELIRHTSLPVSAQPNAGLPRRAAGRRFEYPIDGGYFARYARRYAEAGASLIGGCCGTTPTHLKAAVAAVAAQRPRPGRAAASVTAPAERPAAAPAEPGGLAERLAAGRFVVAAELVPPADGAGDQAADAVGALRERGLDTFLVSPRQTARAHLSPLNLALQLRQRLGADAVATMTTWDKTIMALQADLLGAHALGMRTVVCATGNPPLRGDYPNVDGIWEVDSVGLAGLLNGLNQGRDSNGLPLATRTSFHIGARFNPGAGDVVAEVARTRAKLRAGAQFLISRPVYDLATFQRMTSELAADEVPVLLAIAPLRSFAEAEYLAHEVPGVTIPDATLRAMEQAGPDAERVGLELAAELAARARVLAQGLVIRYGGDTAALERLVRAV